MNKIKSIYKKNEEVTRLLVIMAVWLIFMAFTQARKFYTGMNFLTMAGQFPEYGLMALGGMLCMITGGIDLSVVGTANMASILTVFTLTRLFGADGTMPLAFSVVIFLIAIVTGIVVGSLNAFLISKLGVPPILATLGVNELLTGLCVVMTNGSAISSFPKQYCDFFSGNLFSFIPRRLLVFIVVAIIIWLCWSIVLTELNFVFTERMHMSQNFPESIQQACCSERILLHPFVLHLAD